MGALIQAQVRCMVAGGLAVNAHGYLRFTRDVDLVVDLASENMTAACVILGKLGYKPMAAVSIEDIADATRREVLVKEKNATVIQFWSDRFPDQPVDIFLTFDFDFAAEYARAPKKELQGIGAVTYLSLETLITMKKTAGREQDLADIAHLERIAGRKVLP